MMKFEGIFLVAFSTRQTGFTEKGRKAKGEKRGEGKERKGRRKRGKEKGKAKPQMWNPSAATAYWKLLFLTPVLITYYVRNRAANFVEICNIYANQICIIKTSICIINFDKLSRNYGDTWASFFSETQGKWIYRHTWIKISQVLNVVNLSELVMFTYTFILFCFVLFYFILSRIL